MTRKQIKEQAARYIKYVDWSEQDDCFIGRCPEVFIGAVHGSDEAGVYAELCETVEDWIELLHKDGVAPPDPLTGKSNSVENSCLGSNRVFISGWQQKLSLPGTA